MFVKTSYITTVLLFFVVSCIGINGQEATHDSITTPFKKGRWYMGVSGTINSSTNEVKSSEEKSFTNQYGLNIAIGKFVKDRLLLGGAFNTSRSNNESTVKRTTETIFIGPSISYYLAKNQPGSLFLQVTPGYVRYRDKTSIEQERVLTQVLSEGGGIGVILGVGYSYVFYKYIAFDLGLKANILRINVNQESEPSGIRTKEDILVNDLVFSFGFNIILDNF